MSETCSQRPYTWTDRSTDSAETLSRGVEVKMSQQTSSRILRIQQYKFSRIAAFFPESLQVSTIPYKHRLGLTSPHSPVAPCSLVGSFSPRSPPPPLPSRPARPSPSGLPRYCFALVFEPATLSHTHAGRSQDSRNLELDLSLGGVCFVLWSKEEGVVIYVACCAGSPALR